MKSPELAEIVSFEREFRETERELRLRSERLPKKSPAPGGQDD